MEENYSAFKGLNLSSARSEDETREQYKSRLKSNKEILKLYSKMGRQQFQLMFPNGIHEAMTKAAEEASKEIQEKTAEELGEAK